MRAAAASRAAASRIDSLVRTAPAGTVNGVLRLTEQGEVINQSYGLRPIAMRTLERAFNALRARLGGAATGSRASAEQLQFAARLAAVSRQALPALRARRRGFLRLVPGGHAHRRDHAHADRLAARRCGRARKASMRCAPCPGCSPGRSRATCCRPGSAPASGLRTAIDELGLGVARSAYAEWNFFTTLIDDLEASLARADLDIAAAYEELAETAQRHFGVKLREEFALVREQVLAIKQTQALLDRDQTLQRSIELRNPYVDPINLLQVDLLRRWRESGRQDRELFESLLACIAGIAEGLQSTG